MIHARVHTHHGPGEGFGFLVVIAAAVILAFVAAILFVPR